MIDKKKIEDIKTNMKKYTPEILDVQVFNAHMKECIDECKSYFDNVPERQRDRIIKTIQEKKDQGI